MSIVVTTKFTKDGGTTWAASRDHTVATTGNARGLVIRRRCGMFYEFGLEASDASPFKTAVLAASILVTPEG